MGRGFVTDQLVNYLLSDSSLKMSLMSLEQPVGRNFSETPSTPQPHAPSLLRCQASVLPLKAVEALLPNVAVTLAVMSSSSLLLISTVRPSCSSTPAASPSPIRLLKVQPTSHSPLASSPLPTDRK